MLGKRLGMDQARAEALKFIPRPAVGCVDVLLWLEWLCLVIVKIDFDDFAQANVRQEAKAQKQLKRRRRDVKTMSCSFL